MATSGDECEQRVRKSGGGEDAEGKQSGEEGEELSDSAVFLPVTWMSFREAGKVHILRHSQGSRHENAENAVYGVQETKKQK